MLEVLHRQRLVASSSVYVPALNIKQPRLSPGSLVIRYCSSQTPEKNFPAGGLGLLGIGTVEIVFLLISLLLLHESTLNLYDTI